MLHNADTGKITFYGSNTDSPVTLDKVLQFKYLGIPLSVSPYGLFKAFNEQEQVLIGQSWPTPYGVLLRFPLSCMDVKSSQFFNQLWMKLSAVKLWLASLFSRFQEILPMFVPH